jgi:hypothetical protein
VHPIRILLVDMPRLVRDMLVGAIERQADMAIVGQRPAVAALGEAVRESDAEFVILGLDDHRRLPPDGGRFLAERSRVRLFGIEAVDGEACLYELKPERVELGAVTPESVVRAIRRAASRGRA